MTKTTAGLFPIVYQLTAMIAGARELIEADDKPGLDASGKTLHASELLAVAKERVDRLRALLDANYTPPPNELT